MNLQQIVKYAYILVVTLAIAAAVVGWYRPKPEPQKEYVEVEVPKYVKVIQKVEVPGPEKIVVVEKQVLSTKTELPAWVKDNSDEQVLVVGELAPWKGKTEVISTLNTNTGVGRIISKRIPLPFIDFQNDKEIGLTYGTDVEIYGRWTFLRVGNIYVAGYASYRRDGEIAGIQASYRW